MVVVVVVVVVLTSTVLLPVVRALEVLVTVVLTVVATTAVIDRSQTGFMIIAPNDLLSSSLANIQIIRCVKSVVMSPLLRFERYSRYLATDKGY